MIFGHDGSVIETRKKPEVYTNLRLALEAAGVRCQSSGPACDHLGGQVNIIIGDEQGIDGVTLYFDISEDGSEKFVCQE